MSDIYTADDVVETPGKIVKDFIYVNINKAVYQIVLSFGTGILFAPFSWGLFFIILFILIFEFIYAIIVREFTAEQILIRLAIISSYFLGFLVGRITIGDQQPIRLFFNDQLNEMGKPGHRHPALKRRGRRSPISTGNLMGDDLTTQYNEIYVHSPKSIDRVSKSSYNSITESMFNINWGEYREEPEPELPKMNHDTANQLMEKIILNCT